MTKLLTLAIIAICQTITFNAVAENPPKIGADLYEKKEVTVAEIPPAVIKMLAERYPGFEIKEAETESKNGNSYMDIEGTLPDGKEIEFDLLLDKNEWRIVEIQRDLSLNTTPRSVVDALFETAPDFTIDRIIESDQGGGVIIYEFYSTQKNQKTLKKEVKLENGKAEVLKQEWSH
jgi:hypothetical protein